MRFFLALILGKTTILVLKLLNQGATALPGLITLKIDPQFVRHATQNLNVIVVTGTNGKTTTSRLISEIIKLNSGAVIHNRSGSNLLRGIASTLLSTRREKWAVFESDEAAFSDIVTQTSPQVVLILNLFRDQMDRYGEIDTTLKKWQKTLATLPEKTKVILNADDPALGWLGTKLKNVQFFGIDDKSVSLAQLPHAADSTYSFETKTPLNYHAVFLSHLGIYEDPKSSFKRPELDVAVSKIDQTNLKGSYFRLKYGQDELEVGSALPGVYNIYNLTAASSVAKVLNIDKDSIKQAFNGFTSAFGRFEIIKAGEKEFILFLIKNPAGFDQVNQLLTSDKEKKEIVIGINDNLADGTDISWLWDVDIEILAEVAEQITTTGTRAHEMALRLKYADIDEKITRVDNNLASVWSQILESNQNKIYLLLTYTTMLEFRELLSKQGLVRPFFED